MHENSVAVDDVNTQEYTNSVEAAFHVCVHLFLKKEGINERKNTRERGGKEGEERRGREMNLGRRGERKWRMVDSGNEKSFKFPYQEMRQSFSKNCSEDVSGVVALYHKEIHQKQVFSAAVVQQGKVHAAKQALKRILMKTEGKE